MVKKRGVKSIAFLLVATATMTFLVMTSSTTKLYESTMKMTGWTGEWMEVISSKSNNETYFVSENEGWMDFWLSASTNISVYSAYWDSRYCTKYYCFVRVIAIGPNTLKVKTDLKCILNYNNSFDESPKKPTIKIIPENHGKCSSAIYILCHVPMNRSPQTVPTGLILTESEDWNPLHNTTNSSIKIQVHIRDKKRWKKSQNIRSSKIAVCVRPLFGPFDNIKLLAEFVAYYSNIGVTHFSFYDYNTTFHVKQYLNMLSQQGFSLDFLPWNISQKLIVETWEMGQLAHVQDCIYRHLFIFDFVLLIDLDEYVVLKQENTLQELIEKEDNKASPKGSYMFRNSFFWLENCDAPDESNSRYLNIQLCTKREPKIWPSRLRSKVLLRPETVLTGGIHAVRKYFNGKWKTWLVNPYSALLHHYRQFEPQLTVNRSYVKDKSALKYSESVLKSKPIEIWKKHFFTK